MKIQCSFSKMMDVDFLVEHPKNANKHTAAQIKLLAKLMDFQGWRHPIVVSKRSGFIVAGHGRLAAAKLNGWTEAPIDEQDFVDEAAEYAFLISDNKIAELASTDLSMVLKDVLDLGPDFDFELLGMLDFKLPEEFEPQADEDEVPEHVEPRTKPGDLYRLGRHRLMCGDSTSSEAIDALFSDDLAEICFTSPPYADQREYNGGKDLSTEHLATFMRAAFGRVGYFVVNLGYSRKEGEVFPYWDDYIKEAKECGLKFLSWNIWDKGECGSIGNQTAMFAIQHEWIFVFGPRTKELNLTVANKNLGKNRHGSIRNKDGTVKPVTNTSAKVREFSQMKTILLQTPQKARNHGIDHPAMFPVEFPEAYIEAMTNHNDYVFEPFGGSGSTLIACEKTGRCGLVMELDPHYCDVIVSRWERYTGKVAEIVGE